MVSIILLSPKAYHPSAPFEQLFSHPMLVGVSRDEAQPCDHSRPAYPKVRTQAVEGLLGHLVVATASADAL
jgi:hypothetical protein